MKRAQTEIGGNDSFRVMGDWTRTAMSKRTSIQIPNGICIVLVTRTVVPVVVSVGKGLLPVQSKISRSSENKEVSSSTHSTVVRTKGTVVL